MDGRTDVRAELGGATVLVIAVAAVAAVAVAAIGRLSAAGVDAARARSAADAVALGVVMGAPPESLAAANGARLASVVRTGDVVEVVVVVGSARARARAELVWAPADERHRNASPP